MPNIALLPGDGIGPEVTDAAVDVLNAVAGDLSYETFNVGGAAIDAHGVAVTDEAMAACKAADAVFLGDPLRPLTGKVFGPLVTAASY